MRSALVPIAVSALILLAASCTRAPTSLLEACADAPCRAEQVLPAFDADPPGTLGILAGFEPLELEALLRHLIEARPDALESICRGLGSDSPAWGVCGRLRERPHLIRARVGPREPEREDRPAPGPSKRHPPVPDIELAVLGDPNQPRALPVGCEAGWPCVAEAAVTQLDGAGGIVPGQACYEGYTAESQRNECLFQVAEALAERQRWPAVGAVVRLCVAAGDFAHGCMHHSISKLMPDLPAADRAAPEDLVDTLAAIQSLRQAVGPDAADLYEDFFWSIWTTHSARRASKVDGRLLTLLPPQAAPHVRMAAAYEHLRRLGPTAWTSLPSLVDGLAEALADAGQPNPGTRHRASLWKARDFWPDDLLKASEQRIPAAFCMGPGRRPVSEDLQLDLQLAVLEASARMQPPPEASFYLAVFNGYGDDTLRWTALRLLGGLYPEELQKLDLEQEKVILRVRAEHPVKEH